MFVMTEKLPYTIRIVRGDSSGDGHGRTSTIFYLSSLTAREVCAAYHKGTNILGFDLIQEEGNSGYRYKLKPECQEAMKAHGYTGEFETRIDYETYSEIYFWIVKLGNPNFEVKWISEPDDKVEIGGYHYEH